MKMKNSVKLLTVITSFSLLATATGVAAWFMPKAIIGKDTAPLSGNTLGAYFAYGNGHPTTEQNPNDKVYGITVPRHLYNLAWLQYLGFFNNDDTQYYFELGDNIDMTGWTLPPIGTETNPFIGNFNGNGYVIKGLTVSNQFSDYERHPGEVQASSYVQPHILGFFGAIGDINDNLSSTSYSSAVNEFSNTGLTGLTIKTYLRDSLMGIAAGYVKGNMKNIAVDASTITLDSSISGSTTSYGGFTQNISDFSLVGYTTNKKQIKKVDETIYDVTVSSGHEFNASEQGDTTGWGGSIDMESVTKRLQRIRDNLTSTSNFTYYREYEYHDGLPASGTLVSSKKYGDSNSDDTPVIINNNDQIGHFHFINETGYTERYALLGGGHWEKHVYYESYEHNGRFITDGTNYLTFDGTSFSNTTNSDNATVWAFTVYSTNVYYITTQINGTTYYLNYNNGALNTSTTTGNTRRWQVDDTGTYRDIKYNGDTNYHLTYQNGWTLINPSEDPYYLIHDGNGHYMGGGTTNNATPTNTTEANALKFEYTATGDTRGYYTKTNTYYLKYRRTQNPLQIGNTNVSATYRLYQTTSSTTCLGTGYGTGYLRTTTKNANTSYGTTYYVRWNNGWTTTQTANQATQITIDYIDPSSFTASLTKSTDLTTPRLGPDERITDTKSSMNYTENDVTYFPLSTVDNTSNYTPADNNTAYVVGGSSLTESATFYDDEISNVRFGYYPTSSSFASGEYTSSTGQFSKIYTVNNSLAREEITDSSVYEKFTDARTNLASVMKGKTNVYGLHFMESTISMNSIMKAPYVKVNKVVHEDYELPVNCIDFHLKEFGYINFIAGSYYSTTVNGQTKRNNSFFALYQIERSTDSTINRILEVKNVYEHSSKTKNYSYVYELYDGTNTFYTKPYKVIDAEGNKEWLYDTATQWAENQYETSKPANYNLVFNCARIKKNNISSNNFDKHAWYFEIPMNDGEFCLGSAEGGVGSYLMYLDIGANAAKMQRTTFTEHFNYETTITAYPDGVALVTLPTTFTKEVAVLDVSAVIDCTDSACIEIKAGYSNSFTVDRNNGDVTLTRSNQSNAPPVYAGEDITLIHDSGSSTNIPVVPISHSVNDVKRLTYFDVNVNLGALTKTIITDTSVDGGTATRTITQEIYSGTDASADPTTTYVYDSTTDQRDDMKVYNTSNGVRYSSDNLISSSVLPIGTVSNTAILTVRIVQNGGAGFEEDILLEASIDSDNLSGKYYLFDDYLITITPDGEDVVVVVKSYSSGKTIYYGTTQVTGANQEITISV